MDEVEISVSWRAAIFSAEGAPPVYGHLRKIGKGKAEVKADCNLRPGQKCGLAVRLPKSNAAEITQYVEGQGVVEASVLSSSQFHIMLRSLEIKGDGKALLSEYIRKHKEVWKR